MQSVYLNILFQTQSGMLAVTSLYLYHKEEEGFSFSALFWCEVQIAHTVQYVYCDLWFFL